MELTRDSRGTLHVLYSLRAEGCPRLAIDLLDEERRQDGRQGSVAVMDCGPHDLAGELRQRRLKVHDLRWRRWGYLPLFVRTMRLLRVSRPRGVICYTLGMHMAVAAAARVLNVPCIVHIGNAPPVRNRRVMGKIRSQMRLAESWTTGFAACSEWVASQVRLHYGLSAKKVHTIPNGIVLERFVGARGERESGGIAGITVGMVASLEEHKAQEVIIDAIGVLRQRGVAATLRLVGDGSRRQTLSEQAERLGVSDHVTFVGTVTDVATELRKIDVFAYAVSDDEGLGIALVEAMAAGLSVVASDTGATREVLAGGSLGILVHGCDPEAWADAILRARRIPALSPNHLDRYDIANTWQAYRGLLAE